MTFPVLVDAPSSTYGLLSGDGLSIMDGYSKVTIIVHVVTKNSVVTPSSGWIEAPGSPVGQGTPGSSTAVRTTVFTKYFTVTSGSTFSATTSLGGSDMMAVRYAVYSGVSAITPFNANSRLTSSPPAAGGVTTFTVPGMTTTLVDNRILLFVGTRSQTGGVSLSFTNATITFSGLNFISNLGDLAVGSFKGDYASAGATGSFTGTSSQLPNPLLPQVLALAMAGINEYTMVGAAGSFTLTRVAAGLSRTGYISGATGAFALSGVDAGLRAARPLTADGGVFSLSGGSAALSRGLALPIDAQPYALSGGSAALLRAVTLAADPLGLTLTIQDAGLARAVVATGDGTSFTLDILSAGLSRTWGIPAESGPFALSAPEVQLRASGRILAEAGAFGVAGVDASLDKGFTILADAGAFALTGNDFSVLRGLVFVAEAGAYALAPGDVVGAIGRAILVDAGDFQVSGGSATGKVEFIGTLIAPATDHHKGETGGDQSGAIERVRRSYGGSDRTTPSFNRHAYVKYTNVNHSRDFGEVDFVNTELSGTIGTSSGTNTLYFRVHCPEPSKLQVQLSGGISYERQYLSVGVLDENHDPVPTDDQGFAQPRAPEAQYVPFYQTLSSTLYGQAYVEDGYWTFGYTETDGKTDATQKVTVVEKFIPPPALMPPGSYFFTVSSSQWSPLPYTLKIAVAPAARLSGSMDLQLPITGRIAQSRLAGSATLTLQPQGRLIRNWALSGSATLAFTPVATLTRFSPYGP